MRIETVAAKNFRAYPELELKLGKRNIIVGPNGSGKTSLIDIICLATDGTCRGTDDAGRGHGVLSYYYWKRDDADDYAVSVKSDLGTFTRSSGDGPNSKHGQAIRERLGFRRDALRAVFRPGTFLSMTDRAQVELFTSLAAPEDILPVAREHLKALMPEHQIPSTMKGLDGLEALYRSSRPKLKREITEIEKRGNPSLENFDEKLRTKSPEALDDLHTKAVDQLRKLRKIRDEFLLNEKPDHHVEELEQELKNSTRGQPHVCPACKAKLIHSSEMKKLYRVEELAEFTKFMKKQIKEAKEKQKNKKPNPEIAKYEPRIEKGAALVNQLERLRFVKQQEIDNTAKLEEMHRRLENIEEVCKQVDAKGPLRAALAEAPAEDSFDLLAAVNEVTKAARWGLVEIQLDPWLITMNGTPARVLSGAETLRLNVAFQTAIAKASGIGVLVIDEAQMFDEEQRVHLQQAVSCAEQFVDQIILCASKAPKLIQKKAPSGWTLIVTMKSVTGDAEAVAM